MPAAPSRLLPLVLIILATTIAIQNDNVPPAVAASGNASHAADFMNAACGNEDQPACDAFSAEAMNMEGSRCDSGLQLDVLADKCTNFHRHNYGGKRELVQASWLYWALLRQYELQAQVPLNQRVVYGTHNSTATKADGHAVFENQIFSLSDQLDMGVRKLNMDVHFINGYPRTCHGSYGADLDLPRLLWFNSTEYPYGCTVFARYSFSAVKEIANWLNKPENRFEMLVLTHEDAIMRRQDLGGTPADVTEPWLRYLGRDQIFTPADLARPGTPWADNERWPTTAELLAIGKRLIIVDDHIDRLWPAETPVTKTYNDLRATHTLDFATNWATTRADVQLGSGLTFSEKLFAGGNAKSLRQFASFNLNGVAFGLADCSTDDRMPGIDPFRFMSMSEDRTGLEPNSPLIDAAILRQAAACGMEVDPDKFDPGSSDEFTRLGGFIWSWQDGDMGGNGPSASMSSGTVRWSSRAADQRLQFACVLQGADSLGQARWTISRTSGQWLDGPQACAADNVGATFGVPTKPHDNTVLLAVMRDRKIGDVWLNYSTLCPRVDSGSVVLYAATQYGCGPDWKSPARNAGYESRLDNGWQNVGFFFNKQARSVSVPASKSVRLFTRPNRQGNWVCINQSVPDLSAGANHLNVSRAVSSFEVFDGLDCGRQTLHLTFDENPATTGNPDFVQFFDSSPLGATNQVQCHPSSSTGGWHCPLLSDQGVAGHAAFFDGQHQVLVETSAVMRIVDSFALSAWVNWTGAAQRASGYQTVLYNGDTGVDTGNPNGYGLQIASDGRPVIVINGHQRLIPASLTATVRPGRWEHLAIVHQGPTNGGPDVPPPNHWKLFLNGEDLGDFGVGSTTTPGLPSLSTWFGAIVDDGDNHAYSGGLDDVVFYGTSIGQAEIRAIHARGVPPPQLALAQSDPPPGATSTVTGSMHVSGTALDQGAPSGAGVDAVDLTLDGPPGVGQSLGHITNLAATGAWNADLDLSAVPGGPHTLFVSARSALTGEQLQQSTNFVLQSIDVQVASPGANQVVAGVVAFRGSAHLSGSDGGVDTIQLAIDSTANPLARIDFIGPGGAWSTPVDLSTIPNGAHVLFVSAHSSQTGKSVIFQQPFVVDTPNFKIERPTATQWVGRLLEVRGWVVDAIAPLASGTGIDSLDVFVDTFSTPRRVAHVTAFEPRPDVDSLFGVISNPAGGALPPTHQFLNSGFGALADLSTFTDGPHNLMFSAHSTVINNTSYVRVPVRIDTAPPIITFGAPQPPPNAAGWNNTSVSIPFTVTDVGSGVALITPPQGSVLLTTEASAVSGKVEATDVAGNLTILRSPVVMIDRSPPGTIAVASPPPGQSGWNTTDVTVTLTAVDGVSSVASTEYNLDSLGWTPYATPLAISSEGEHTLLYRSVDVADNVEVAHSLAVRIDKTPPEAVLKFDPISRGLALVGRDSGSGVPTTPVPPASTTSAGLRTYRVVDVAGNTLVVTVLVSTDTRALDARVVSLQVQGGNVVPAGANHLALEWSLDKGAGQLATLHQTLTLGSGALKQTVNARFDADKNQTVIRARSEAGREQAETRPGLVLVRLATNRGKLSIEF